jgi:hypothetical protein
MGERDNGLQGTFAMGTLERTLEALVHLCLSAFRTCVS